MARTDPVLTPFVIGPESRGRGYQLLAPAKLSFSGARDLAMILMEWSRTGEKAFAGCLPLPGAQDNIVVFRARHLGRQALGEAAFLNGVLVTPEDVAALGHRTELILEHIDAPDGSADFADKPVVVRAPTEPIPPGPWEGLGLAWRDRYIVVDAPDEREDVLLRALASIDPPEQRPRVAAWVTSARLVSRGALDPLGQAQLIVGDAAAEDELPDRLRWTAAGGPVVTAPESWTTWLRFQALFDGSGSPGLGPALRWRPDYARLGSREIAAEALRIVTGVLAPDDMIALLARALAFGDPFGPAATQVAADYAEALGASGMDTAMLQPLWSASEQSAALTRALLRFAGAPIGGEIHPALEAACAAMRAGELDDEQARGGLTGLMRAAIAAPGENIDILSEIIDAWPNSSKTELFSLTSPGSFEMMYSKSEIPAKRLSLKILRRDCYAFGVRGKRGSVILDQPAGLREALRAIATMRASACPD